MSGSSRTIALRLTLQDADTVRNALKQLGTDGDAALQKITAATAKTSDGLDSTTASGKLASYQLIELAESGHKFADAIISGQSALKAFAYEAPNAIAIAGGWSNAVAGATRFLTGGGGLVAGIAAVGVGLYETGKSYEQNQEQLLALSQRIRATRDDYADMAAEAAKTARTVAGSTSLNYQDALKASSTIVSSPFFSGSAADLQRLTKDASDLGTLLGTDAAGGAQKLTMGMKNAVEVAKQLEAMDFKGFDAAEVDNIARLQDAGQAAEAFSRLLGDIETAAKGATHDALTPLEQALTDLDNAWTGAGNSARSFRDQIGAPLVKQLTDLVESIVEVKTELGNLLSGNLNRTDWTNTVKNLMWTGWGDTSLSTMPPKPGQGGAPGAISAAGAGVGVGSPWSTSDIQQLAAQSVSGTPVPADLFRAMIQQESGWGATSKNLGQVLAGTAAHPGYGLSPLTDVNDAASNLFFSSHYLAAKAAANGITDWSDPNQQNKALQLYNGGGDPDYVAHVRRWMAGGISASGSAAGMVAGPGARDPSLDAAQQQVDAFNGVSRQLDQNSDARALNARLMSTLTPGTPRYQRAQEYGEHLVGQTSTIGTPQALLARNLQDQQAYGSAPFAGAQTFLQLQGRLNDLAQSSGHETTPAESAQAFGAQIGIQNNALTKQVANLDLSTQATQRMADATGKGQDAMAQAQATSQAYQAALQLFPNDMDQFRAALDRLLPAYKANGDAADALRQKQQNLSEIANTVGEIGQNFFSAVNGASSWKDAMTSAINTVANEIEKLAVLNPIMNAIDGGNRTMLTGSGGIIDTIAAKFFGSYSPETAATTNYGAGTTGLDLSPDMVSGGGYHSGGIVGFEPTFTRMMPAALYGRAARYHQGGVTGLATGDVPAVLQQGEGVFTAGQMKALGAAVSTANQPQAPTPLNLTINAQGAGPREVDILRSQMPGIALAAVQNASRRGGKFAAYVQGKQS